MTKRHIIRIWKSFIKHLMIRKIKLSEKLIHLIEQWKLASVNFWIHWFQLSNLKNFLKLKLKSNLSSSLKTFIWRFLNFLGALICKETSASLRRISVEFKDSSLNTIAKAFQLRRSTRWFSEESTSSRVQSKLSASKSSIDFSSGMLSLWLSAETPQSCTVSGINKHKVRKTTR